ncbi:ligase-associated DNA damage response DEXH box helicase [Pararhodonellum marinum]|uniref:ligase-associated DNA damage response DEXH box helicase n=1 Tax=Pararhodonellum marinum TaxID=2755358 RepID=UPI00188F7632|nr:ligase-associated DNA damage response DEXH box helicase [Pararhodonellum marinum]
MKVKVNDLEIAETWFQEKGWEVFDFQQAVWKTFLKGQSGLLNAPTGSGKTYALWFPILMEYIKTHPDTWQKKQKNGLQIIWITPLRALALDIQKAMIKVCEDLGLPWQIGVRNGDTSTKERQQQKKNFPECLITTPESLHLLLAQKENSKIFETLKTVVVDEWHELLSNKRGVQIQLALSHLKTLSTEPLKVWGISATIGNLDQAHEVLIGKNTPSNIIKSKIKKKLTITSILPDEVEKYPWAGHLGIKLLHKILPVIEQSRSTLLFTNTRSQTEIWYQKILEKAPHLAGLVAMHHGSLDMDVRTWVENALHEEKLKLVVCTSSLDLGVDFRPVDTVIQVGGPKGVSRFAQRAGRSGHQPGAPSSIFFVPTHSLELVEASALRKAIAQENFESQHPLQHCIDVLIQFLVTLAVGEGFEPDAIYQEVKSTYAFENLKREEFDWCLDFITKGGESLKGYTEFAKVEVLEHGIHKVNDRKVAMRHRLSMGTIVSDPMMKVKYLTGGFLGVVEENFISRIKKGDVFWFAGKSLEFVQVKDMTVLVRRSKKKTQIIPRWMGGRMPLSSQLSQLIRSELSDSFSSKPKSIEIQTIQPILDFQQELSMVPDEKTLLIEKSFSKEGCHVFIYPFEGRFVHEVLAALVAYRISVSTPISFSIAMNDYGFELLSAEDIPIEEALEEDLFSEKNLLEDIRSGINESEMSKRKFRDIAFISGLVFQGLPGRKVSFRHLQATSGILYGVFEDYDPQNLLLQQARWEALTIQMEKDRVINTIRRINQQQIILNKPMRFTPFAFPIMVDRLSRTTLSSESLEERVLKMQAQLIK